MRSHVTPIIIILILYIYIQSLVSINYSIKTPSKYENEESLQSFALYLREQTKQAFIHSYDNYLNYAFPYDELKPLSCEPRDHLNRSRGTLDDVLGGYMLTLIDSLDTLIVLRENDRFFDALDRINKFNLSFDNDIIISVFEANIRILGGLLSAHQLASYIYPTNLYNGTLLDNARDLGDKLLIAFSSSSGIPYHRINLKRGVPLNESKETCTAAATSYLLEMSLLSHLTGNQIYGKYAKKALMAVWNKRSSINLVGAMINVKTGKWIQSHSGIGAGIDSFYETILKSAILLGDDELMDIFNVAYSAVQKRLWYQPGYHREVNMRNSSVLYSNVVSSLQAFWPALQVLHGQLDDAIDTFDGLEDIWDKYKALPDMYDIYNQKLYNYGRDYPLRPEMIESAYHLYSATRDNKYLMFGYKFFKQLQSLRTTCGFASIADVSTGRLDDRMDSYFLAETLKYLYLLFDEASHPSKRQSIFCNDHIESESVEESNRNITLDSFTTNYNVVDDIWYHFILSSDSSSASSSWIDLHSISSSSKTSDQTKGTMKTNLCLSKQSTIFTTEGHLLIIDPSIRDNKKRTGRVIDSHTCPIYE